MFMLENRVEYKTFKNIPLIYFKPTKTILIQSGVWLYD